MKTISGDGLFPLTLQRATHITSPRRSPRRRAIYQSPLAKRVSTEAQKRRNCAELYLSMCTRATAMALRFNSFHSFCYFRFDVEHSSDAHQSRQQDSAHGCHRTIRLMHHCISLSSRPRSSTISANANMRSQDGRSISILQRHAASAQQSKTTKFIVQNRLYYLPDSLYTMHSRAAVWMKFALLAKSGVEKNNNNNSNNVSERRQQ